MSTPFDINVPVTMGEDVVLNFEDGSQVVGTPQELVDAAQAGNIIGLHFNPAVIPDPNAPATLPDNVEANSDAPADPSQGAGLDTSLTSAPADAPADVPAPDAPEEPAAPEVPEEEAVPADATAVAPTETPVEEDTAKLDEDVKTLETDEGKPAGK